MPQRPHIDPAQLSIYMMPDGALALDCEGVSPEDLLALFGDNGIVPPRSLIDLLEECLHLMAQVPDDDDAELLDDLASTLRAGLSKIEASRST